MSAHIRYPSSKILDQSSRSNLLLSALPAQDLARLRSAFEEVTLEVGQVLHEPGFRQEYAYFPTSAIISLLYLTESGGSAEMAMTGREGVVGLVSFMGGETMANQALVQNGGRAMRMRSAVLKSEFQRGGSFHNILLRYTMSLITQMSQTSVCNRLHHLDRQLCRWLLLSHDRLQTDELVVTQDMMASMLGVRREGVSVAAGRLQRTGIINYSRGRLTILDRAGLEAQACECYHVIKSESDRLLSADLIKGLGHSTAEKRAGHGRRVSDVPP